MIERYHLGAPVWSFKDWTGKLYKKQLRKDYWPD